MDWQASDNASGKPVGGRELLADLPTGEGWSLELNSQDIEAHSLGELQEDATGGYCLVGEGEYLEVWATVYRAPYHLSSVYERVS